MSTSINPTNRQLIGNRYLLQERIGVGGMGAVYRAVDRLRDEKVALKRLSNNLEAADKQFAVRLALANEFRALVGLRHPHIIAVRDYGFDRAQQPFFTMELIAQPRSLLSAGQFLDTGEKIVLLVQLLSALTYLHRRGIVHRDLKPGNVLLSGRTVKVLDFGLATLERHPTQRAGTIGYLAPEVIRGQPATPLADLYAVGVLAYELLAGWHPFADAPNLAEAILHHEPDFTYVDVEPALSEVLRKLLAIDPAARYPDAQSVIAALSAATDQPLPNETTVTRESFLQTVPLTGRDEEVQRLANALDAANTGQGSSWLVGGESGIGKSRLLQEIRTRALVQGMVVLQGLAVSAGGEAYQLWRDSVRHLILLSEPSALEAAVLLALVPDLASLLQQTVEPAPALDPKSAQTRLHTTIADLVLQAAEMQPLLFLFEDLHWIDENSLELLQRINQRVAGRRILILASYRADEDLRLVARLSTMEHLHLQRLQPAAIATLSEAMLGNQGRRSELVEFLQQESEGNAFFVVEVMRSLAEEAGQLDQVGGMALPAHVFGGGIQQVVNRRLQRVRAPDRPLLDQAAVAGRQLDLSLLQHLLQRNNLEIDLEQWLTDCANAAILAVDEGGLRWQFNHDKVREGILAQLEQPQRLAHHHQLGAAIETIYATELAPHYGDLAWHFGQAGVLPKERFYLKAAAESATHNYANRAAIGYYQRLLAINENSSDESTILLAMAQLLKLMGEWSEAEAISRRGIDRATAVTEPIWIGRFEQLIGTLYTSRGNYPEALDWLQQAQSHLSEANAWAELCVMLNDLGVTYHLMGEYDQASHYLQENLQLAQMHQQREPFATALQILGRVAYEQGDYTPARAYFDQALEELKILGRKGELGSTMNNLANLIRVQGDFAEAKRLYQAALLLFEEIGDKVRTSSALNNLGIIAQEERDFDQALQLYERSMQLKRELNETRGIAVVSTNMAGVYAEQGAVEQATTLYQQALTNYRQLNNKLGIGITLYNLGEIASRSGNYAAAYAGYFESLELLRQVGDKQMIAFAIIGIGALIWNDQKNALRTIHLLSAAKKILTSFKIETSADVRTIYQQTLDEVTAQVDSESYQQIWSVGQTLDLTKAIDLALSANLSEK